MATVIYEGTTQFMEHEARAATVAQHMIERGHNVIDFYWESLCRDCRWKVTLSVVDGNPFNPHGRAATQRVTLWEHARPHCESCA